MAEYIDREAAIAKCREIAACEWNHRASPVSWADAYEQFAEDIEEIPAADVAPVRHGEWEIVIGSNGKEYMVCTCCRVSQDLTGVFTYCPNCGSKMDGGED